MDTIVKYSSISILIVTLLLLTARLLFLNSFSPTAPIYTKTTISDRPYELFIANSSATTNEGLYVKDPVKGIVWSEIRYDTILNINVKEEYTTLYAGYFRRDTLKVDTIHLSYIGGSIEAEIYFQR